MQGTSFGQRMVPEVVGHMEAMLESAELADVILVGARGLQVQVGERASKRHLPVMCHVDRSMVPCSGAVFGRLLGVHVLLLGMRHMHVRAHTSTNAQTARKQ